jgi:hypothetical protein
MLLSGVEGSAISNSNYLAYYSVFAVFLDELRGFACSLAEVIQFRSSGLAASSCLDIDDVGRVQGEYPFDAFTRHDSADREGRADAPAFAGDDRARKNADTLFVAFFDSAMDVNNVTDFKMRKILLHAFAFDHVK